MNKALKDQINSLKTEIDALRPLDRDTEGRIQQKFRLDWNYHSNHIEGNSLTFGETKSFILHGITAAGKPLKDHLDIKGHNDALIMLEDVIKEERALNEIFIRELHQIILHEPYEKPAVTPDGQKTSRKITVGQYKTQPNHVVTRTGEIFYFARPEETPALMNDLVDWLNNSIASKQIHPVELAALLHYKFIRIHPFDDGNGRISRILMNLVLMRFGFPPVIIKTQKKDEYYQALQRADGNDTDFFVNYIAQLQIDSLELYLRGAKGERIEEDDDIIKEIELFKLRMTPKDSAPGLSQLNQRFEDSIKPFLYSLNDHVQRFFELFNSIDQYRSVDNTSFSSSDFDTIVKHLDMLTQKPDELRDFSINYRFKNLKKTDFPNEITLSIAFQFRSENYSIKVSSPGNSKKLSTSLLDYKNKLSEEERASLIKQLVQHLMKLIEQLEQ